MTTRELIDPITRLTRDLRKAAATLTDAEARFLVDIYYQMQDNRIRAAGQVRAQSETGEPHDVLIWFSDQSSTMEQQIKGALQKYVEGHEIGPWCLATYGIGPVISAGVIARIDIQQCPTVGHIWAFAGLDPSKKWGKGEKRPWNAALKRICFLAGESFVKFKGAEQCYYGHVYAERKAYEAEKNERGDYVEQAEAGAKRVGKTTEAFQHYSEGRLPPGHLHMRAMRYAVKLWLAHLHEVWWTKATGTPPPLPYPVAHMGHAHKIDPPH